MSGKDGGFGVQQTVSNQQYQWSTAQYSARTLFSNKLTATQRTRSWCCMPYALVDADIMQSLLMETLLFLDEKEDRVLKLFTNLEENLMLRPLRKTIGKKTSDEEAFDFTPLTGPSGVTLLKFGRSGPAREKVFFLSKDLRVLSWDSQWFCFKFGRKNIISMDRVRVVQKGQKTRQFLRLKHIFGVAEDKSLSLIYRDANGNEKSLDIMCPNKEGFKYIYTALKKIVGDLADECKTNEVDKDRQYLRAMWNRADSDHNGTLNKEEIFKLVQYMNINMSMALVKDMFKRVDLDDSGALDYNEFISFMEVLRRRPEIDCLWVAAIDGTQMHTTFHEILNIPDKLSEAESRARMAIGTFTSFWNSCQSNILSEEEAEAMVSRICQESDDTSMISHRMWVDIFCSQENDLFASKSELIGANDMSHPLSHYFIDCSHATYLDGDQLMSRVTLQRYIDCLRDGVRCLDIKCWDGDKDGPVVHHGHGITGRLLLADVLKTIAQVGFEKNPYPIILNLENYCTAEQQLKIVQLLKTTFKKCLASPPARGVPLPSPAQLKGSILLRGARTDSAVEDDDGEGDADFGHSISAQRRKKSSSIAKARQAELIPELSHLIFFGTATECYNELSAAGSHASPNDVSWNLSESKCAPFLAADRLHRIHKYHESHLGLVRPKVSRVDASNFDPMIGWMLGAQLVALNQQTADSFLRTYRGRFRENGRCGYVLKPEHMLSGTASRPIRLIVNILGAHQLPKPANSTQGEIIDPYVVATLHGAPGDGSRFQTRTVLDNGFCPLWNEVITFEISAPDLAILTLEIFDEDVTSSEFVAYTSIPVRCMVPGVRNCRLMDKLGRMHGEIQYSSLSLRVAIEQLSLNSK